MAIIVKEYSDRWGGVEVVAYETEQHRYFSHYLPASLLAMAVDPREAIEATREYVWAALSRVT